MKLEEMWEGSFRLNFLIRTNRRSEEGLRQNSKKKTWDSGQSWLQKSEKDNRKIAREKKNHSHDMTARSHMELCTFGGRYNHQSTVNVN